MTSLHITVNVLSVLRNDVQELSHDNSTTLLKQAAVKRFITVIYSTLIRE